VTRHPPPLPLADELEALQARLSGSLLPRESAGAALRLVTSLVLTTVPAASGASVTAVDDEGRTATLAATDGRTLTLDDLQYRLEDGPCLQAHRDRSVVRVDDTDSDDRWPRWAAGAAGLGVGSSLSAPLVVGDAALGVLKVYAADAHALDGQAEQVLTMFAGLAGVLAHQLRRVRDAGERSDLLKRALAARDVVNVATGVVMSAEGLDRDAALTRLVTWSHEQGRPVEEVARRVVRAARIPKPGAA